MMSSLKTRLTVLLFFTLNLPVAVAAELDAVSQSLIHGVGLGNMSEPVSLVGRYRADFSFEEYPVSLLAELGAEIVNDANPKLFPDISMGVQYSYDVIKYIPHGNVQIGARVGETTRANLRVGGGVSRLYQSGWFTFGEIVGRTWLDQEEMFDATIFVGVGFTHDFNELY